MPLPTMSLRAAPEHQQIIRDIATALRTRPELADVLRDVLQTQHGIAPGNTGVLQSILERLAALEEREPRMVRIEALETRMAALEGQGSAPAAEPAKPKAQAKTKPQRPKSAHRGAPPIPEDHLMEALRLWDGGKGSSPAQIIAAKKWPYHRSSLFRAMKRQVERAG